MKRSSASTLSFKLKSMAGLSLAVGMFFLSSCDQKPSSSSTATSQEPEEKTFTGTFSVGSKSFTGKISTQKFPATGEFSVLCQDDASGLIQLTFHDEVTARTPQNLTSGIRSTTPPVNHKLVSVTYMPFGAGTNLASKTETADALKITKTAEGNEVSFDKLPMTSNDGTTETVSGKLTY